MNRLLITAILASTFCLGSAKKIVSAKWEYPKYEIPDSIYILDYSYNSNGKLFYMLSNDSENLYIHAKFVETASQKKLLTAGFTVWLDLNAKGKEKMGIKYPLPPSEQMNGNDRENARPQKQGQDFGQLELKTATINNDIELINFPGEPEIKFISTLDNDDIHGNIAVTPAGIIHYTLKIPYHSIGFDYAPGKLISVILESGELDDSSTGRPSGMSGGAQSSMGGGSSGGMGGGPPGGGGGGGGGMQGGGSQMSGGGGSQSRTQSNTQIRVKVKHLQLL